MVRQLRRSTGKRSGPLLTPETAMTIEGQNADGQGGRTAHGGGAEGSCHFVAVDAKAAEQVAELAREIWPICFREMISPEQIDYMLDWMYAPERIRLEIRDLGVQYWFIVSRRETLGYLAFGPEDGDGSGRAWQLHKLYLKPVGQGRGLGSAALAFFEEQMEGADARLLRLRVNRGNERAIRVYERAGYRRVAERCADIGGGFVMDDYVMEKTPAR